MSLATENNTAHRGFPRLKHKLSNIFSNSSLHRPFSSASRSQTTPEHASPAVQTPVLQTIQGSPNTSPRKARTSKPRSGKREQSKAKDETTSAPQKLELPKLDGLQWGSEFELHVPYLNFEPSRSGNAIDWDKELETYKRQSRDISNLNTGTKIPQVLPSPVDDGRSELPKGSSYVPRGQKVGSLYSDTHQTSESRPRANTDSAAEQGAPVVHHVVCQECQRPQSELISQRLPLDYGANVSSYTTRDQISSRSSYNNSPYLATESVAKDHSTRTSPSLFGDKPGSRPPTGRSSGAPHRKSPSLSTTSKVERKHAPTSAATSVSAAKKKWEVREVTLLQPVGSSQNAAAANVSKTIEAINTGDINAALTKEAAATHSRTNTRDAGLGLNITDLRDDSAFASKSTSIVPTPTASRRPSVIPDTDRLSMIEKRRSLNSTYGKYSPTLDGDRGRQQGSSMAPGSRNPSVSIRRSSSRISGDRLSWIRPDDATSRAEGKVFSKLSGGVAAKLAKFESQGVNTAVTSHPTPYSQHVKIARSDSSNSRTSDAHSIGGSSLAPSLALTRRTTVDTVGGSPGSLTSAPSNNSDKDKSSVMTNFDESFRLKMEMLAGSLADKASSGDDKNALKGKPSTMSLRHQARSDEEIGEVKVDDGAREKHQALLGDMLRRKASRVALPNSASKDEEVSVMAAEQRSAVTGAAAVMEAPEVESFNASMLPAFT